MIHAERSDFSVTGDVNYKDLLHLPQVLDFCHGARPDRPRQAITCGARQSRAALLAWRAT